MFYFKRYKRKDFWDEEYPMCWANITISELTTVSNVIVFSEFHKFPWGAQCYHK